MLHASRFMLYDYNFDLLKEPLYYNNFTLHTQQPWIRG